MPPIRTALGLLMLLFFSAGAGCPRSRQVINDAAPTVLGPEATLNDVLRAVNANSARIQQIQSDGATLDIAGLPTLNASYALERPSRFRLRADLLGSTELDLGSNDEIFWMWVKRNEQPAIYWGRHEDFYRSAARDLLPVPPHWLIEALGVVEMDPTGQHEGPYRTRPGQLEVRSQVMTPAGPISKITIVDDARGWILEQHLFDAAQRRIASAVASGFQFDPNTGGSLPRRVEVSLPSAQLNFTLQTDRHVINQLVGDPSQLWSMPRVPGVPQVNLMGQAFAQTTEPPSLQVRSPQRVARQLPPPVRDAAVRRLPPFDRIR